MNWYYTANETQHGPIEEKQLLELVKEGRIHDGTYLWHEGLDSWKFFSEIKSQFLSEVSLSTENSLDRSSLVKCISCNQSFPQNDCLSLSENRWACVLCKPKVVQQMKEGINVSGTFVYAGFWRRFGSKFIDSLIQMIVTVPVSMGISMILPAPTAGKFDATYWILQGTNILFSMMIGVGYNTFLIGKYGATWGKMTLGLKVIRPDGSSLTYGRACGRYFAEMLSGITLGIGYLMCAFDKEKRALHDRVADTRVIIKKA